MRRTDKCGVKPKKAMKFGADFHKAFSEAADRITVKAGGMTGKKWFRAFKANNFANNETINKK